MCAHAACSIFGGEQIDWCGPFVGRCFSRRRRRRRRLCSPCGRRRYARIRNVKVGPFVANDRSYPDISDDLRRRTFRVLFSSRTDFHVCHVAGKKKSRGQLHDFVDYIHEARERTVPNQSLDRQHTIVQVSRCIDAEQQILSKLHSDQS